MKTDGVMMQVVAGVERGEGRSKRTYWTRIGVAFQMRDGVSWQIRLDYVPRDPNTTLQLRPQREREDEADTGEVTDSPPQ